MKGICIPLTVTLTLQQTDVHWVEARLLEQRTRVFLTTLHQVLAHGEADLDLWKAYVPSERMRVLVFEEDVAREPSKTVQEAYEFLGLDPDFLPRRAGKVVHRSWTWTRILLRYFTRRFSPRLAESRLGAWLDRHDVLGKLAIRPADIEFLRPEYLPERPALERLLNRSLDCWTYGQERLTPSQNAS